MRLSLAALAFYVTVFILWSLQIIPAPIEIFAFLETLFSSYGLLGIFIATLLESIVFIGLYFPGSFILVVAIFFSGGTFQEFFIISLITSISLTIGTLINYTLGKYKIINVQVPKFKSSKLWFLLTFLHPNSMAFYFYSQGLRKQNFNQIKLIPFFILVYGMMLCYLFYSIKYSFKTAMENPYIMITVISMWVIISYTMTKYKKIKLAKTN